MGWSRRVVALVGILGGLLPIALLGAPYASAAASSAAIEAAPVDPFVVDRPRFEPIDESPLGVAGFGDFRGAIELTRSGAGISVVNHVSLDDYLRGISEVPVSWPLEAQKAQAIAARTYALYELGRKVNASYKAAGADICATDACQVYAGLTKERRAGSEAWSAAVDQTKGQVLIYNGAPIAAKYSSSNGGQTVSGGQPYLRATDDPDDRYSPLNRWRATYPLADVARVVGFAPETTSIHRGGDEIIASSTDADGNTSEQRMAAADFRSRINNGFSTPAGLPLPVPSVRFDAGVADGVVYIDGRGWGHGIGLSQYGALGKSLRGLKAPDILAAYYAGLRPVAVPNDRYPQRVRVALALDRSDATVTNATGSDAGQFRIVDADGRVIAHRASGAWSARPAPDGRVRLVPPGDQAVPATASLASTEPATPRPGKPITARLSLDGPSAITRLTLVRPDGTATELDGPKLRTPGPVAVRLSAAATPAPGAYRIDVERDAGGGRVVTTGVPLQLDAPPTPLAVRPDEPPATALASVTRPLDDKSDGDTPNRGLFEGLATVLLVAVVVAGAFWVGRRPGIQLH